MDNHKPEDVTQDIIDIVNKMGEEIVTNTRIMQFANLFNVILGNMGSGIEFVAAIVASIFDGIITGVIDVIQITKENLK
ncbi:hypothetical protein [Campylobacter sputorum]|uniref:hypothetical protein n=1 Tax=Campylobacter sputorum TaxID=206 RepID=UPI000B77A50A|nr:hypothetical protein [Campylobacter sputorum]ASM36110.1 hypothetical protein CSF_0185 [Campylobacter sputorum bv. faecalis CCUG 20703]